ADPTKTKTGPSGGPLPVPSSARPRLRRPAPALRGDAPLPDPSSDQRLRTPAPVRAAGGTEGGGSPARRSVGGPGLRRPPEPPALPRPGDDGRGERLPDPEPAGSPAGRTAPGGPVGGAEGGGAHAAGATGALPRPRPCTPQGRAPERPVLPEGADAGPGRWAGRFSSPRAARSGPMRVRAARPGVPGARSG